MRNSKKSSPWSRMRSLRLLRQPGPEPRRRTSTLPPGNTIAAAGYGENFLHRCGHGLGIDIHEPPYITATSERVLEEGNVFSIEPGIYLAGRFGVRLEEIVILKGEGCEVYSEMDRGMKLQG